jgi:hypothetical protein
VETSREARALVLKLQSGLLQEQESELAGSRTLLLFRMTALARKAEGVFKRVLLRILPGILPGILLKFSFLNALTYKGN